MAEGRTWGIANDNPVEVPDTNLHLWLRADKSVYTDAGATTLATNGTTAYWWNDQSAQANHHQNTTAGERPTYRDGTTTAAINFKPTLEFDGSNDYLYDGTSLWATANGGTTNTTIFVVAKQDDVAAGYNEMMTGSSDNPVFGTYGDRMLAYDSGTPTANTHPKNIKATVPYLYGWDLVSGTNGGVNMRLNGELYANTVFDPASFSSQSNVGGDSGAEGTDGKIAEIIVYKEVLSQTSREKIESYLAIKYGLTLSQQAVHFSGSGSNNSVSSTSVANPSSLGQTFIATSTGTVHTITVSAATSNTATSANLYICDSTVSELATPCIAAPGATKLFTLPASPTVATPITIQLDAGFAVTSGSEYVIHIRPVGGNLVLQTDTGNTTYANGIRYTTDTAVAAEDLIFSIDGYGTAGRDYVASNGSVVWDASESTDTTVNTAGIINTNVADTAADDYVYHVAAIAKDNVNVLLNTVSQSQGEVTPFLSTEVENTSLLDDKEFMFVGATSAVATPLVMTDMPVGLPTATNSRTPREWRVQKNAIVSNAVTVDPNMGTFKLSFDLDALNLSLNNVNGFRLVVDDNGDFSGGTQTIYPSSGEPTYDAATNSVIFTGIALADGQYFTLALPRVSPGGVWSGIRAWYRADAGTYTTTANTTAATDGVSMGSWMDQSGNAYHFGPESGSANPEFRSSTNTLAINYNPVVDFENAENDILETPSTLSGGVFGASGSIVPNIENYQVIKQETYGSASHSGLWGGQNSIEFIPGLSNTDLYFQSGGSISVPFSTLGSSLNTPYLYGTQGYSTGTAVKGIQQDGKTVVQNTVFSSLTTNSTTTKVGSYSTDEQNYDGVVGDLIFYAAQHTASEINKINSYLAVKYGLTQKGGELQLTESADSAATTAIGQIFTAKTNANIIDVSFKTASATVNTASQNIYFCTGAIVTTPNSTNVAACIAAPLYQQAVTVPAGLSTVFSATLSTPFPVTAGTQYAIVLGGAVGDGKTVRMRVNATDVYPGATISPSMLQVLSHQMISISNTRQTLLTTPRAIVLKSGTRIRQVQVV
jgi:hypothetical protein